MQGILLIARRLYILAMYIVHYNCPLAIALYGPLALCEFVMVAA